MTALPASGSIFNLDWGQLAQFTRIYLGPSIGWQDAPVAAQTFVSSAAPLTVTAQMCRVILKAAVKAVQLPSVAAWVTGNQWLLSQSPFDRSLWVKDFIAVASVAAPIVVTPAGTDLIDGLPSFSIIAPGGTLRLYPMTDLTSGWYVG
jgi:hypothetical protein